MSSYKQRQKSNLPRKRLLFCNALKNSNEVQPWIAPTVASHRRATGCASPAAKKTKTRKSGQRVHARNRDANPAVSQATRGIPSSRLITRTRLLISCQSNVRIVRPNSHLMIQRIMSEDRFLTFLHRLRLLLPSIVLIFASAKDVAKNSRVNFRQM